VLSQHAPVAVWPGIGARHDRRSRISPASGGHHAKDRRVAKRSAHAGRRHRGGAGKDEGSTQVRPRGQGQGRRGQIRRYTGIDLALATDAGTNKDFTQRFTITGVPICDDW